MSVKLSEKQLNAVKSMAEFAENMADQFLKIMVDFELDKVEGCSLSIDIRPELEFTGRTIRIGCHETDFGHISLVKGRDGEKYEPMGRNSTEYELLFADETLRSRMEKVLRREKPLPPDGLWVGDSRNDPPVDCGEWDLNDSLS